MSDGLIGYHPGRVDALFGRVRAVVDDLSGIDCDDPAAATAMGIVRLARSHLESGWLPLLDRIRSSMAMIAPISTAAAAHGIARPTSADDGMGPPSSEEVAADLIEAADKPARPGRSDQVVLSNGWSWGCGPVSASTGQPASGCEFQPPTDWDLSLAVAAASVLPGTGELIDAYDCAVGAVPCEAMLVPFLSGRSLRVVDDALDAARRASRPARSVDEILMPDGAPLGRQGSNVRIREVTGTLADAEATFIELSQGGELIINDADHILIRRPDGGTVGLRTKMTDSPGTIVTVDVKIPGYDTIRKIKFNP